MDAKGFGVRRPFFDESLGGFATVKKLPLPLSARAVGIVDAVMGFSVMCDLGYFHTFLLLGVLWCLLVP